MLPNPDGTAGAITIDDGKTQVPLDLPYAAGEVRGGAAAAGPDRRAAGAADFAPRSPRG